MLACARFLISNLFFSYFFDFLFSGILWARNRLSCFCNSEILFFVPTQFFETFSLLLPNFRLNWSSTHSHTQTLVESSWKISTRRKKFFRVAFFLLAVSTQFATALSRHCHVAFLFFAFLFLLSAVFFSGWKYFTA